VNQKNRNPNLDKFTKPGSDVAQQLDEAIQRHQRGELEAAKQVYEQILAVVPDHAMVLNLSGVLAHQAGDGELAIRRCERALELEPENGTFHNNLGEIFRNLGELDEAEKYLRKCLGIAPNDAFAHNNLGSILLERMQYAEAIQSFKKSLEIQPGSTKVLFNLGVANMELGRPEDALGYLAKALSIDPEFADGYAKIGEAHYQLGRYSKALENFRKAFSFEKSLAAIKPSVVLNNMGSTLRRLRRTDEAIARFREALGRETNSAFHLANLAGWLEELHSLDEARELAETAIAHEPTNVMAGRVMARIELRSGELEKSKNRLEGLLQTAPKDASIPAVFMELGQVHDRLRQWDKAFSCWLEGNQRLAKSPKWRRIDKDSFLRGVRKMTDWIDTVQLDDRSPESEDDDAGVPVFLVGFPRSGTTLLEQVIAAAGFTVSDELPFVSKMRRLLPTVIGEGFQYPQDLERITFENARELRAAYWSFVRESLGDVSLDRGLLDKNPLNICDLGLIWKVFPGARVIVVLRDPRDSCLRSFMQNFDPNFGMAPFLELKTTADAYASVMGLWLRYRAKLPLPYLEVRYEDMVGDFDGTVRGVMNFIGVPWQESLRKFHENSRERYISTPSYEDVTTPIYDRAVGRWQNYKIYLKPVLPVLEPYVSGFGYAD
jgi:Tfp pilus assembly protein PilF